MGFGDALSDRSEALETEGLGGGSTRGGWKLMPTGIGPDEDVEALGKACFSDENRRVIGIVRTLEPVVLAIARCACVGTLDTVHTF